MRRFALIRSMILTAGLFVTLGAGISGCANIGATDARESSLTKGLDVYEIQRINQEARVRNASVIWINPPEIVIEEENPEQEKEQDAP